MIIAIPTSAGGENDVVSPVFGRAPTITFVEASDNKTTSVTVVPNPSYEARGGAGIATAQMIVSKKASAVIASSVGPNAYGVLSQSGVKVFTASGMTVKQAVEKYLKGELAPITAPSRESGAGFGRGAGSGYGRRGE